MDLTEFQDIWTTDKNSYALISLEFGYAIVNTEDKSAILIESEEIHNEVVRKMLENGNAILEKDWFSRL